jgi:MoxR-like ATPase
MQEYQVTLEGETMPLPQPFIVMATQNPIEYEGTFPLPEAQLDRFIMKLAVGYPTPDRRAGNFAAAARARRQEMVKLQQVTDRCRAAGHAPGRRARLCGAGLGALYGRPGGGHPRTSRWR